MSDDLKDYPSARQDGEGWWDFVKRQSPEMVNGVAMALAGIRAPGAMALRGPAQGLTLQDLQIARQRAMLEEGDPMIMRHDPGITSGGTPPSLYNRFPTLGKPANK